ncbi:type IV secretion protein Dot [Legionella bononiensis]|uniref:Type IV secretion protein Dot n=1 Tax=Legionella bononiensis TaxID=2793102 RepID=A0ABS1WCN4_9GAMM|nr:type IV secretion protein Dot [Legionella bononiensis]MBL7478989.1 type IV secretion protein Dot [Legionella bononiensis]MBL7527121.1 type IV secretion protein Dot [Legionella bononiensis]MBL7562090.1 type IV secretion protein Dot [Legionella bononiensis]
MPFTPPSFPSLRADTLNLDEKLSITLGRYKIVPVAQPSASSSSIQEQVIPSALEILLARTDGVINCKSDRLTVKEALNLLSIELREILKEGKEDKCKQATQFLLGALLHRYFRLLKEYDKSNSYVSYFYKPFDERNCQLFVAVRKALGLPDDMPKDYRKRDLEKLDVTTVVTALTAFRENMKLNDRFLKYPHYADDPNFQPYLEEIIKEHLSRGQAVLQQFKAIRFIQSLVRQVDADQKQTEETIVQWCKQLAKDHRDFKLLKIADIEQHLIKNVESESIRDKIADLLYTPMIEDNLVTMDHSVFVSSMTKANLHTATYTIVGGYSLLLLSGRIQRELSFELHNALGISMSPDDLTFKDMLNGAYFFQQYMKYNPSVVLDYEYFNDRSGLDTYLSNCIIKLTEKCKVQEVESPEEKKFVVM